MAVQDLSELSLSNQESESESPSVEQAVAPESRKATDFKLPEPGQKFPQSADHGTGSTIGLDLPTPQLSECHESKPASFLSLPEQSTCQGAESSDPSLSNLPEPPEEPLQSDCCGTGCSPCVFDIYEEDMKLWRELAALTPEERVARMHTPRGGSGGGGERACVALSTQEYRTFEVVDVQQVSSDSRVFTFALPADHVLGVGIGQHAVLRVEEASGHFITRQYTPVSEPDRKGSFKVLIKLYENGMMSRHIKKWKIGSKADWRGPFGNFTYKPNQYSHIGMLACGTGIAPMIQIARAVVENDEENTFIHCLYACRTQHDILLKQLLDHFKTFWNFTVTYALSGSTLDSITSNPGKLCYGDTVHHGRINKELIQRELSGILSSSQGVMLICGTKSFDKDMINFLHKLGCTKSSYFKF